MEFDDDLIYKYDSDDMIDHIKYENIYLKYKNDWRNPGYISEHLPGLRDNQVTQKIAEEAAGEWLVPLYSVMSAGGSRPALHELAVEDIAYRRRTELQAEVRDGVKNEEDILGINNDADDEEKERVWTNIEQRWTRKVISYLNSVLGNQIPVMRLEKDEVDRAVSIFDNMNKGGTPLSTFDLIVARSAQNRPMQESLIDQISSSLERGIEMPQSLVINLIQPPDQWVPACTGILDDDDPPTKTARKHILNILSTLYYVEEGGLSSLRAEHAKKKLQLKLSSSDINSNIETCIKSFCRALAFLQMRCGVSRASDISYDLMMLPISHAVVRDEVWLTKESLDKIEYWYWSSIVSGHYRENQNARAIKDVKKLLAWIENDTENPFASRYDNMFNASVYSSDDMLLRTLNEPKQYPVPSAVHDSILQYIISLQPKDFLSVEMFDNIPRLSAWQFVSGETIVSNEGKEYPLKPEVHHVCPLAGATRLGQSSSTIRKDNTSVLNSPILKTVISKAANRIISDKSESEYFDFLSSLVTKNHLLPDINEFGKEDNEGNKSYYLRLAKKRLNNVHESVRDELDRLVG